MKVYLDNAATSYPKAPNFYEETMELYKELGVNASRGKYSVAEKMLNIELDLRKKIANIFNISNSKNVILSSSATVALNQIIQGIDYSDVKHVYISPFEHNAVYRPLLYMQKQFGFKILQIPFNKFSWDKNKTKVLFESQKPDVVVMTHASNVFGNILPVKEIFSMAKEYESLNILDTAQTAGLLEINLKELRVDFAAFAGHKSLYGPSGIGGFVINSNYVLKSILFGGTGINSEDVGMPSSYPERYEVGSMNSLAIIGLNTSLEWLLEKEIEKIRLQKIQNFKKLISELSYFNEDIKLIYSDDNVGVLSCIFNDYSCQEMGLILDEAGICTRSGLHCAPLAHKHIGTIDSGTVRFSLGYFNIQSEFNELNIILNSIF
ncbi:aminotransferase class V-fold PLP-dependent enzyme [Lentisphaerota bacterium WC36G]|nr:aminotransferase class V-fold PLP-dependent enzyme [Lentisphaerae bacterium WC36]